MNRECGLPVVGRDGATVRGAVDGEDGRVCKRDPATCTSATCQSGTCVFSPVLNCCQFDFQCDGADLCTVSACDPQTHTCRHDPVVCGSGQACCGGTCKDVTRAPANCGARGNASVANQPWDPRPPNELCPDRGSGCETGVCSNGRCAGAVPICGGATRPRSATPSGIRPATATARRPTTSA